MKKIFLCALAIGFLLCACAAPAADTASEADVSAAASETPAESQATVDTAVTDGIGKALTELKEANPTFIYAELDGPDCYYGGLVKEDQSFAYLFFGAQDGLTMADAAEKHGDQLYCSGVYTTVGEFFTVVKDNPLDVDDFLAAVGASDVSYWFGWVSFRANGYNVDIHCGSGNAEVIDAKPIEKINANMVLILTAPMQMEVNGNILHY